MSNGAAESREVISDLKTNRWLPKPLIALNGIGEKHGWTSEHSTRPDRGRLHSRFELGEWVLGVEWTFKGDIKHASIASNVVARQTLPKEFRRETAAFVWVADLLYDLGVQDAHPGVSG